ncbi:hypothetical protein Tco_1395363, partial [Tanacetum coccineum]
LNVNASRAKRVARNHDPLALVANTYASPSYSRSSQSYYVTHPPSVHDFDDDYQGDVQGDEPEDKLSTAMMLLAREITQHFSTPINNHLCTSFNTRNQACVQDGRVDIQSKNVGMLTMFKGIQEPLLIMGKHRKSSAIIAMKKAIMQESARNPSKVNDSQIELINGLFSNRDPEQQNHEKLETIKPTSIDDQINCNIISDDPYVEVNGGQVEHTYDAHDQKLDSFEYMD